MISKNILDVLQKFYQMVNGKNILWILTGSTALAIQGVDIETNNNIDVLTDKAGAKRLDELLSNFRIERSQYSKTEKYKSYFGKYKINNVLIEIMGEFQYRLKDGLWSKPNQSNEIHKKDFDGMTLPLLSLEKELEEYKHLDRLDKVEKIKDFLK